MDSSPINNHFQIPKVVHCHKSEYTMMIDRSTKWGNPFRRDHIITKEEAELLGDPDLESKIVTRDQCIDLFKHYLEHNEELLKALTELDGQILGCWCKNEDGTGKRCHGDAIVEVFIEKLIHQELFEY
jgi:hypothetical protein